MAVIAQRFPLSRPADLGGRSRRRPQNRGARRKKPPPALSYGSPSRAGPRRPPSDPPPRRFCLRHRPHGRRARAGHASWRTASLLCVHDRAGARTHPKPAISQPPGRRSLAQWARRQRRRALGRVARRRRRRAAERPRPAHPDRTVQRRRRAIAAEIRGAAPARRRARRGELRRRARELRAHLFGRAARGAFDDPTAAAVGAGARAPRSRSRARSSSRASSRRCSPSAAGGAASSSSPRTSPTRIARWSAARRGCAPGCGRRRRARC